VAELSGNRRGLDEKAARRAARELIAAYHQEQLGALPDRVRDGFALLDCGEIDEFDLDDLIHRYKRAAADLWTCCGSSGAQWLQAANMLTYLARAGRRAGLVGEKCAASRPFFLIPDGRHPEQPTSCRSDGSCVGDASVSEQPA
jgi:hypothetical protein